MKKVLGLFLIITVCSCQKNDVSLYNDTNYPTVYKKKSVSEISQAKTDYFLVNKYIQSSLNEFGFCDFQTEERFVEYPAISNPLIQSEAEEIALNFLSKNNVYAGIPDVHNLQFVSAKSSTGISGNQFWHLKSATQKIDTIEVMNTGIVLHICNREVYLCNGNWYPKIYVPGNFIFDQWKAREKLVGRVVSHYTIAGIKYEIKITSSDISSSSARLVIYPVSKDDRIELRVTWEINIPGPVYYKIYLDVMTGEIISEEPTIIS